MKHISVIISSLRPEALEKTIDTIAIHKDIVEVVVVSPWKPRPRDYVKYVRVSIPPDGTPVEREQKGELSLSKKINLGIPHASGKYLVFHNDDLHFRPGWAPALFKHMESKTKGSCPYLAAFMCSYKGIVDTRHTVFGLLYANLGCISKKDLDLVGGYLYDERLRTEYVDPDLSLRVWSVGGEVGICSDVVIDIDSYTKINGNIKALEKNDALCTPYKLAWARQDAAAFFDIWFWKYFWLFFINYSKLNLCNSDNVLPKRFRNRGPISIFMKSFAGLLLYNLLGQKDKINYFKFCLARLVNRRWKTLEYQLPYKPEDIIHRSKTS